MKSFDSPLVSIIVPIYNAERYLDKCIESILKQSYSNIEVLLVDDGSPDNCPVICDEWATKDSRIRVVHQNNGGVTVARKIGVQKACGDWICFVDADDVLPRDSISHLFSNVDDSVDVVIGQISFNGDWKWPYRPMEKKLDRNQYIHKLVSCKIHSGPVARLFRKALFNHEVFNLPREIRVGEDYIMNVRIANNVRYVYVTKSIVYEYISNPTSASAKSPFTSLRYCRKFEKELRLHELNVPAMYKLLFYLIDWYIRRKRFVINGLRK